MQLKQLQKETLKKFMLGRAANPSPYGYRCSAIITKLLKPPLYNAKVANRELVTL